MSLQNLIGSSFSDNIKKHYDSSHIITVSKNSKYEARPKSNVHTLIEGERNELQQRSWWHL